jgi:hypothetical protein
MRAKSSRKTSFLLDIWLIMNVCASQRSAWALGRHCYRYYLRCGICRGGVALVYSAAIRGREPSVRFDSHLGIERCRKRRR